MVHWNKKGIEVMKIKLFFCATKCIRIIFFLHTVSFLDNMYCSFICNCPDIATDRWRIIDPLAMMENKYSFWRLCYENK